MITDRNQVRFAKMVGCGLQEVLNENSFSRLLEQVDSKIWRLHLLLFEYVIRAYEWVLVIQKEEAGGLDFHLGH